MKRFNSFASVFFITILFQGTFSQSTTPSGPDPASQVSYSTLNDPLYTRALKADSSFKYRPDRIYGTLNVETNVTDASFYLGGWYIDRTPISMLKLPVSQYPYKVMLNHFNEVTGTLAIKPKETSVVNALLYRKKGLVRILTNPDGIDVSIGNRSIGKTTDKGLVIDNLDAGSYIVKLEKKGFRSEERQLRIIDGEKNGINVFLTEQYGTLIFESDQPKSFVYVNNIYWGTTPITVGNLRAGKSIVKIEQERFAPWIKTILIKPGEIEKISANLKKDNSNRNVSPYGELKGSWGDRDGDGIPNDMDKYPDDPEDIDGYQDQDGCPDPDNDNDGIADITDKCPLQSEDFDNFEDQDGCPDLDNDKDNIADSIDLCLNTPEDRDGFEDMDGCPDYDNDIDGIPDSIDVAPIDPEDIDGFQDKDGTPDLDNDNDGVKDYLDACPNEPEVFNNFQDDDGCPDELVPEPKPGYVKNILYTLGEPLPEAIYTQLDSIYNAMMVFPAISVEITVNCDGKGRIARKLKETQEKAVEIEKYLGYRNHVDKSRYRVTGVGAADPISSNVSDEGRIKNTRVSIKRAR